VLALVTFTARFEIPFSVPRFQCTTQLNHVLHTDQGSVESYLIQCGFGQFDVFILKKITGESGLNYMYMVRPLDLANHIVSTIIHNL